MRVDIVWEDERWPTQEIELYWAEDADVDEVLLEEDLQIYECEVELNEELEREINGYIGRGYFEGGPHQVIEHCGMHGRPDYMGTVRWFVIAEAPDEQAWLEDRGYALPAPVAEALRAIQEHRRAIGQRPLDPLQAGWLPRDILAEAQRIRVAPNPHGNVMSPAQQDFTRNKHRVTFASIMAWR